MIRQNDVSYEFHAKRQKLEMLRYMYKQKLDGKKCRVGGADYNCLKII